MYEVGVQLCYTTCQYEAAELSGLEVECESSFSDQFCGTYNHCDICTRFWAATAKQVPVHRPLSSNGQ
jgi:hypothetical protein